MEKYLWSSEPDEKAVTLLFGAFAGRFFTRQKKLEKEVVQEQRQFQEYHQLRASKFRVLWKFSQPSAVGKVVRF